MRYIITGGLKATKTDDFKEAFMRGQTEKFYHKKVEIFDTKLNRAIIFENRN